MKHAAGWPTEEAAKKSKKYRAGGKLTQRCRLASCAAAPWHLAAAARAARGRHATTSSRRESFPPRVCRLVDDRDTQLDGRRRCLRCPATTRLQRHHRRIKGMGGDTRPCTDCPCNAVTLCQACHAWAHANRAEAELLGLIVPASTAAPGLHPVTAQWNGAEVIQFPTCDGRWIPEGAAA